MEEKTRYSEYRKGVDRLSHRLLKVPQLLGRDRELAFLENHFDAAKDGQGRFVLLSGEAGIGKTRLVEEFQKRVMKSEDVRILTSYCSSQKKNFPYNMFTRMCIPRLEDLQHTGEHEETRSLRTNGSPNSEGYILPLVDSMIREEQIEDAEFARRKMFYGVSQSLLRLAAETPLLIILEDIHWADATSLQLLHSIARNVTGERILVVITHRPEEIMSEKSGSIYFLADILHRMGRELLYERLELLRLSRKENDRLIKWYFPRSHFSEHFLQSIYARTQGNPYFTKSLLELLVSKDIIVESNKVWSSAEKIGLQHIPDSLHEILRQRLNGMNDTERAIIECAAAVGERFAPEIISEVRGIPVENLVRKLDSVGQKYNILIANGEEYLFNYALIEEMLCQSIDKQKRRNLHQQIGAAMENIYKDQIDSKVDELAYHFSTGSDEIKALPYLERAGERAKNLLAYQEALNYFESALSILENAPSTQDNNRHGVQIIIRAGEMHQALGNWDRSLEYFKNVLDISEELKDEHIQGKALMKVGLAYVERSDWTQAESYLNRSLAIFQRFDDLESCGYTITCIADIHFKRCEWQKAWDFYEEALETAMRLVDKRLMARIFNNLGAISDIRGDFFEAIPYYSKSLELYSESEDYFGMAHSYHKLGMVHANKQEWEEAIEFYNRSIALWQKTGELSQMALTYLHKAVAYLYVSDTDGAERWANLAGQNLIRVEDPLGLAECNKILGIIGVRKQEWHYAQRRFEESVRIYESCENLLGLAESYQEMGFMYRIRAKKEKALEAFQRSMNIYKKLGIESRVKEMRQKISTLSPP
ncbi:MAG: tetratricopeptide repeat protein [Gemmatimonadota bacterium]|nr:MAG: tetratricopeptide repeat protein [Gemmatimonadota bacterium]